MYLMIIIMLTALCLAASSCREQQARDMAPSRAASIRVFSVKGVVVEPKADGKTMLIKHEAIPNYMAAMTMPFKVRDTNELNKVQPGDEITFRLTVTDQESWIQEVTKTGRTVLLPARPGEELPPTNTMSLYITNIPDFNLTNEYGQRISQHQFKGQAVAFTFFFTRCPVPDYCPRLSRNFSEASARLQAMTNGPRNYHFLSISFEPLDQPAVLKAYAHRYYYDSNHWSLLTGDAGHIQELTRGFGLNVTNDGAFYAHDFRTVIFDATGRLQTVWPFVGDATEMLVAEMLKAAAVTNH